MNLIEKFYSISSFLGLPPLVLIFTAALFMLLFFIGIMILTRIRDIRRDLSQINRGMIILNQEVTNKMENLNAEDSGQKETDASGRPDIQDDNQQDLQGNKPDIKSKIISLLKGASSPVSYSEIAKSVSENSTDYDFEFVLTELEHLKAEGKIVDQVSAGKLYYRIH